VFDEEGSNWRGEPVRRPQVALAWLMLSLDRATSILYRPQYSIIISVFPKQLKNNIAVISTLNFSPELGNLQYTESLHTNIKNYYNFAKMAERSEAKSVKRRIASKYFILNFLRKTLLRAAIFS